MVERMSEMEGAEVVVVTGMEAVVVVAKDMEAGAVVLIKDKLGSSSSWGGGGCCRSEEGLDVVAGSSAVGGSVTWSRNSR